MLRYGMISLLRPIDDRIICYGMSCVGKTHFAQLLEFHSYLCFDAYFKWHEIETLGLSSHANLKHIVNFMEHFTMCVLDGWHLSDPKGELVEDAVFYVIYAPYEQIVGQYRIPVGHLNEYKEMFRKWYEEPLPERVRYIRNTGSEFVETTVEDYLGLAST